MPPPSGCRSAIIVSDGGEIEAGPQEPPDGLTPHAREIASWAAALPVSEKVSVVTVPPMRPTGHDHADPLSDSLGELAIGLRINRPRHPLLGKKLEGLTSNFDGYVATCLIDISCFIAEHILSTRCGSVG